MILDKKYKLKKPEDFDRIVSAEIPDKEKNPRAYEIVTSCLMHGQHTSNSSCMKASNGKYCDYNYPKSFQECTTQFEDGYPNYRRRNDGKFIEKKNFKMTNEWVVPHNLYLSVKYNAHINVEICTTIRAVKYLYKYIYKGHDRTIHSIQTNEPDSKGT